MDIRDTVKLAEMVSNELREMARKTPVFKIVSNEGDADSRTAKNKLRYLPNLITFYLIGGIFGQFIFASW